MLCCGYGFGLTPDVELHLATNTRAVLAEDEGTVLTSNSFMFTGAEDHLCRHGDAIFGSLMFAPGQLGLVVTFVPQVNE